MENSKRDVDIVISGAGPTGLMLGNLLAKQGLSFRIIEQDSERHKESRALAIQARSLELIDSIGLTEKFLEEGVRAKGMSAFVKGRKAVEVDFADIGRSDTPFPYIFFLSQSVTETILEDELKILGFKVERNTKVESFNQDAAGASVRLKHNDGTNEIVTCRYLVGCDGARSDVRKSMGLTFEGGTYDSEFLLADAKINWTLPADRLLILFGGKNLGLIMPLKGSELSRVVAIGQNDGSLTADAENLTTRTATTIQDVERVLQEAASQKLTLTNPQWVTRYRVHHRSVEKMRVGRVFLAGDAAHIHSPAGGQGMNTGLQDAANLAWKLASVLHGKLPEEILETYNSERMPIATKLLSFTDRIFSAATSHSPMAKKIRNVFIPFAGRYVVRYRVVRRYLFGFISQLNIHYHDSPVAIEKLRGRPRTRALRVGDRAPDAGFDTGGSIFESIRGYDFHVLVMSYRQISAKERAEFESAWKTEDVLGSASAPIIWIDPRDSREALRLYGVHDLLVSLVRPDGYIGYQRDYLT